MVIQFGCVGHSRIQLFSYTVEIGETSSRLSSAPGSRSESVLVEMAEMVVQESVLRR